MLSVEIDEINGIAILEPDGPLSKNDFESVAKVIDPYIEKTDHLNGLLIHVKSFPGWDSFAALSSHLKFVRDHHKKVSRIAFSTDSVVGNFAEAIASHFVNAEIKLFSYSELEQAKIWLAGDVTNKRA
jgi:SpoIIAA-like